MNYAEEIRNNLIENKIPCSIEEGQKLAKYMEGILYWNEKVNLTAIKDPNVFIEKHFIDSLYAVNLVEIQEAETVMDIGTGGGFPGVPLAIMFPEKEFVLLDSLSKRLKIINELSADININNVETCHGRAEDFAQEEEYREKFDLVVSRAVAELNVLVEYCLPFVKLGGTFIAYKSQGIDDEIAAAEKAVKETGGRISRIKKVSETHSLIIIKKEKKTPKKYPRKAGVPKKDPIK